MRSINSISRKLFVLFAVLSSKKLAGCNPITNSNMNDHIREFSSKNDVNSTDVKTLQKQSERYVNLSPIRNPVRFKDVSDSALSSSSYSRGLVHHEHPGYTLHEYEESPIYGYEYPAHPDHHVPDHHVSDHHGFDHHVTDHYHGHHGGQHDINYHHKHYDHALAAKAFLWPIAGIALLGAAAALVSNPVLLQLGVVSGRRKRRDTEETFDTLEDTKLSWLKDPGDKQFHEDLGVKRILAKGGKMQSDEMSFHHTSKYDNEREYRVPVKYSVKQEALFKKLRVQPTVQTPVEIAVDSPLRFSMKHLNENKLIPVPLVSKEQISHSFKIN